MNEFEITNEKTEVGKRRYIVSVGEIARRALKYKGIEDPTDIEIKKYVERVKGDPDAWEILLDKAHQLRASELELTLQGNNGRRVINGEELKRALLMITNKYLEIDKDPARNLSCLDDLFFK